MKKTKAKPCNKLPAGLTRKQAVGEIVDVCFGFQLIKYRSGQGAKRLERDLLRVSNQTLRTIFISALIADRSASHGPGRLEVNAEVVKTVLRKLESERNPVNPKKRSPTGPTLNIRGEARQALSIEQAIQRATRWRNPSKRR